MQTFVKLGKHLFGFLTLLNKFGARVPGSVRREKPTHPPIFSDQVPESLTKNSKSRNPTSKLTKTNQKTFRALKRKSRRQPHTSSDTCMGYSTLYSARKSVFGNTTGKAGIWILLTASVICVGVAVVNSLRMQVLALRTEASEVRLEIQTSTALVQRSVEDVVRGNVRLEKRVERGETRLENLETLIMDHHGQLERMWKLYKNLQIEFNTLENKKNVETH